MCCLLFQVSNMFEPNLFVLFVLAAVTTDIPEKDKKHFKYQRTRCTHAEISNSNTLHLMAYAT